MPKIVMDTTKRIYEMNVGELEQFIREQKKRVAKLHYERPGSAEYRHESEVLKDANQLLEEKRSVGPA